VASNDGPQGEVSLRTIAMPADTNPNGDIFGGWLVAQMDLAGGQAASARAHGRVEAWSRPLEGGARIKVTEGKFTFVAIDASGRPRAVPAQA
jgi:acyl-CoA thioesterase YciA